MESSFTNARSPNPLPPRISPLYFALSLALREEARSFVDENDVIVSEDSGFAARGEQGNGVDLESEKEKDDNFFVEGEHEESVLLFLLLQLKISPPVSSTSFPIQISVKDAR